jgi:hypothetical protein
MRTIDEAAAFRVRCIAPARIRSYVSEEVYPMAIRKTLLSLQTAATVKAAFSTAPRA